jgi:hypothetical protein
VLFPAFRVVSYYGVPGTSLLGVLGAGTPEEAAARLVAQSDAYATPSRPVLPAFELIATVAAPRPDNDGLYRLHLSFSDIHTYLEAVRRIHGLLILDIQPGRGDFMSEVRRYTPFLIEPDVGIALDPEWHTGPDQIPGQVIGSVDGGDVDRVARYLEGLVRLYDLPEKLLVVHQFAPSMITNKNLVRTRPGVATTITMDGYGTRSNKLSTYQDLVDEARVYSGLKLFYRQDLDLLQPSEVLALEPTPALVIYQ